MTQNPTAVAYSRLRNTPLEPQTRRAARIALATLGVTGTIVATSLLASMLPSA
jgi:hypothetical protein